MWKANLSERVHGVICAHYYRVQDNNPVFELLILFEPHHSHSARPILLLNKIVVYPYFVLYIYIVFFIHEDVICIFITLIIGFLNHQIKSSVIKAFTQYAIT